MRVLHLIGGEDFGGAKSHVISLVNELKKNISVKIITFRKGAFSADAEKLGIEIEVVKSKSIFADIKRVIQIIKDEQISIVHSHGAKANMFAVIIKILTKVTTVTTVHSDYKLDYMDSKIKKYSFGLINALALRLIDFHIGVSRNFKEMLISRHFNPQEIFKLYNGIEFDVNTKKYCKEAFLKKFNLNIPKESTIVGILARLHPVKGIDIFLDAAAIVSKLHPDTQFIIGGDGEERKMLEDKAKKLGIYEHTHFIGYIDDPYEFMECIDINTLTSRSESFPYVILEGANQHKTVICSNVGGISDLIINGKNGFLFPPCDYEKMAEYVIKLIENPSLRDKLGENLYLLAKEKFSLDNMRRTQLDIYQEILEKIKIRNSSKNNFDVILSGYYGFNNLGDEAMLLGIIDSLTQAKKHLNILILSKNPIQTRLTFGCYAINRLNIFGIIYNMRKSKLFINGGGNLIQDNTSTRSLLYYLTTIWLAKQLGMYVMIYGNGIGPLKKTFGRKISSHILNQVDIITLREKISLEVLKDIHVFNPQIVVTADPALTINLQENASKENILFNEGLEGVKNIVGYSIRKCPGDFDKKIDTIAKIADYITVKYNTTPVFIPMHYPTDVHTATQVASRMRNKAIVITKNYCVSDIMQLFQQLDLLIGMRLHSLIFAAKLGIPIIGISYEPKVNGFLESVDFNSSINIENLDYETFTKEVDIIWPNRAELKKVLAEKSKLITSLSKDNSKFAIELLDTQDKQ